MGSCSACPWEQAHPSSHPTSDCPHTSAQSRPPPVHCAATRASPPPGPVPLPPTRPASGLLTPCAPAFHAGPLPSRLQTCWLVWPPSPFSSLPLPSSFEAGTHLQCPPSAHSDSPSTPLRQTRHQQWPACPPASPGLPWSPPYPPTLSPASPSPLIIPMDSHSCQAAVSPQLGAGSVSELEPLPDFTPLGPRNTGSACVLTWGLPGANKPRLAVLPAPHLHLHGEAEPSSSGSRPVPSE